MFDSNEVSTARMISNDREQVSKGTEDYCFKQRSHSRVARNRDLEENVAHGRMW